MTSSGNSQKPLLVASTAMEIADTITCCHKRENVFAPDMLVTGVGMIATTFSLVNQIHLKKPSLIIQAGICGGFPGKVEIGSVYCVKEDLIGDEGVVEKGQILTVFDLGLSNQNSFPFKNGRLGNEHSSLLKKTGLKGVRSITVNNITVSPEAIDMYQSKFDPDIESMEGAALHYVCSMMKIPFVQIRAVSNYIGERDKKKWKIKQALSELNKEVIRFYDRISGEYEQ